MSDNQEKENKPEQKVEKKSLKEKLKVLEKPYDKYYKLIMLIPVILLILGVGYLYFFSQQNGDIIKKDISLTGGTSIEIYAKLDIPALKSELEKNFKEVSVREVSDILSGEQIAVIIETTSDVSEVKPFLEDYLGYELNQDNSSIEFTGSSLSGSFYNQLRSAILISFIFMSLVVFAIFRTPIPSMAVIFAAFTDIMLTIVTADLLGISVSTAGIVAILMLIGYSVDTDILLTTRVLKRKDERVNTRIFGAFKTGITMTLTSIVVVIIGLILTSSLSKVFSQIFTVVSIGLVFDIITTWLFNAGLIKWYVERKNG